MRLDSMLPLVIGLAFGWFGRIAWCAWKHQHERLRPERHGYGTRLWW